MASRIITYSTPWKCVCAWTVKCVCVDNRRIVCREKLEKQVKHVAWVKQGTWSLLWVSKTATQGLISIESANAWDDVCVCECVAWGQFELDGSRLDLTNNNKPGAKMGGKKSWGNSKIQSGNVYLKILREREREKIYGWIDEAFKFIITRYTRQANERKGCW